MKIPAQSVSFLVLLCKSVCMIGRVSRETFKKKMIELFSTCICMAWVSKFIWSSKLKIGIGGLY